DPHELPAPERRVAFYRQRCLACHEEHGCSLPAAVRVQKQPDDSCTACHMPRLPSRDVVHTAVTDHRILRTRPEEKASRPEERGMLVSFYRGQPGLSEQEANRNRGLALVNALRNMPPGPAGAQYSGEALPLLESGSGQAQDDVPAWEAMAHALFLQGRLEESLATSEAVLAAAPNRELTLVSAAAAAEGLHRRQAALDYWQRVVAGNPYRSDHHFHLARVLGGERRWTQATQEARAAVRLNPGDVESHLVLAVCLLRAGNQEEALAEIDTVKETQLAAPEHVRRWFAQQPGVPEEEQELIRRRLASGQR